MHRVRLLRPALLAALTAVTVAACGSPNAPSSTESSPRNFKEAFQQLEAKGKLPILDRTDTIEGVDANHNGVRDDIEAWIASLPDTELQKHRLTVLHQAIKRGMMANLKDEDDLREAGDDVFAAAYCAADAFPGTDPYHDTMVRNFTVNTRQRYKAYGKFNAALNGAVWVAMPKSHCK